MAKSSWKKKEKGGKRMEMIVIQSPSRETCILIPHAYAMMWIVDLLLLTWGLLVMLTVYYRVAIIFSKWSEYEFYSCWPDQL